MNSSLEVRRLPALSWILLVVLLFLRFPLLIIPEFVKAAVFSSTRSSLVQFFMDATYVVTGFFILNCRKQLSRFFLTRSALWAFVALPIVSFVVVFALGDYSLIGPVRPIAAVLFAVLMRKTLLSPDIGNPKETVGRVLGSACLMLAGLVLTGLVLRVQQILLHLPAGYLTGPPRELLTAWLFQMTNAGLSEEPLFRGILLGLMLQSGMKKLHAVIAQTGLFMLGHLYYLFSSPLSFFLVPSIGGLVLGCVALRHRSISYSIAAHGIINGFASYVALAWSFLL